jgi:arylsulfatase A-like enzyme
MSRAMRVGLAAAAVALCGAESRKPNVVVILADDVGYGDVGFQGGAAKTPHLDRLAAGGVRLTAHYVYPMCSPTRAALLTGRYPSRFGCVGATNNRVLPFDTLTLASALKAAGYDTALCGKWHLGSKPEWGPQKFGFDHSYGLLAGGCGPYDHKYKTGPFTDTWHRDGKPLAEDGHVTDLVTADAVRFIGGKRDKPFLLYVPYTAAHIPIDEPKRWLDVNPHLSDPGERLRAADLSHLDDGVGQILAALDNAKLRDDTLVLFLSDNGAHRVTRNDDPLYPGKYPAEKVGGSNAPFRGFKTELYEGAIRTPAVASWPGRLKPGVLDAPVHVADWVPTLCGLAGYAPAKDPRWDGADVWPVLSGAAKPGPRAFYWLGTGRRAQAVRVGDWKLILPKAGDPELYDLAADPGEKTDLAGKHPDRVADLKKRLADLAARDDDALAKD